MVEMIKRRQSKSTSNLCEHLGEVICHMLLADECDALIGRTDNSLSEDISARALDAVNEAQIRDCAQKTYTCLMSIPEMIGREAIASRAQLSPMAQSIIFDQPHEEDDDL